MYVNVQYRNNSNENLSCRRTQWILYDADGYTYDPESKSAYFELFDRPPLSERVIPFGRQVRGWLAFKVPKTCRLECLQFLSGYLTKQTAEFSLDQK